jgi:hypothetical protein
MARSAAACMKMRAPAVYPRGYCRNMAISPRLKGLRLAGVIEVSRIDYYSLGQRKGIVERRRSVKTPGIASTKQQTCDMRTAVCLQTCYVKAMRSIIATSCQTVAAGRPTPPPSLRRNRLLTPGYHAGIAATSANQKPAKETLNVWICVCRT